MGNDEAYGRSKAACERYARGLQDSGKPPVTVYPWSIVGPDDWTESINLSSSSIMWFEKGFPIAKGLSGNYVDVRDVAAVVSACLHPGQGPKRLLAFGTNLNATEHLAALTEATGAKVKTFPTPHWFRGVGLRTSDRGSGCARRQQSARRQQRHRPCVGYVLWQMTMRCKN